MAEEVKQEETKTEGNKMFSTLLKVILGMSFLIFGLFLVVRLRGDILNLVKGCIGPFLILAGIVTLAIAKD